MLDVTCNFLLVFYGDNIDGIFRKLANGKGQDGLHALLKTEFKRSCGSLKLSASTPGMKI